MAAKQRTGESTPADLSEFARAVDAAILGDTSLDAPEAQPDRMLTAADFPGLYVRYRHALELQARRFLTDEHDVEDVVQETFLRLFLGLGELEQESAAIAFARRVLTNLCIDRYRAASRRPTMVNLDLEGQTLTISETYDDPVIRAEDAAMVRDALARLSPLHRAALVKREIEEKPLPQIAAELDIPQQSVKHVLFRARRAMRRALEERSTLLARTAAGSHGLGVIALVLIAGGAVAFHGLRAAAPSSGATSSTTGVSHTHQVPAGASSRHHASVHSLTRGTPHSAHPESHQGSLSRVAPARTGLPSAPSPTQTPPVTTKTPVAHRPPTAPSPSPTAPTPPPATSPPPSQGGSPSSAPYTVQVGHTLLPAVVGTQSRSVTGDTTTTQTSLRTLPSNLPDASYAVHQNIIWVPDSTSVQAASFRLTLPTGAGGTAGYRMSASDISVSQDANGTVNIVATGDAQIAGGGSAILTQQPVTVQMSYAPDGVQLVSENVQVVDV